MYDFIIRPATTKDVPFLVETIIEAEKSGTDKLSYTTIFGLSEAESRKYITQMFLEEVDGCELSISSFLVVEKDGKTAAALSAWIEGNQGVSSSVLKGNLLKYILPERCLLHAQKVSSLIHELNIEYTENTIQIGAGFVAEEYRGNRLLGVLNDEIINRLSASNPDISEVYAQIFSNNFPSIRTYEKAGFRVIYKKKALSKEILNFLPSDEKILMKRESSNN